MEQVCCLTPALPSFLSDCRSVIATDFAGRAWEDECTLQDLKGLVVTLSKPLILGWCLFPLTVFHSQWLMAFDWVLRCCGCCEARDSVLQPAWNVQHSL